QIVRIEIAVGFGEFLDDLRELLPGKRLIKRFGRRGGAVGSLSWGLLFQLRFEGGFRLQRCGLREKAEYEGRQKELPDSLHDRASFSIFGVLSNIPTGAI